MLQTIGFPSLDALISATVPANILRKVFPLPKLAVGLFPAAASPAAARWRSRSLPQGDMDLGKYTAGASESDFLSTFKWVMRAPGTPGHPALATTAADRPCPFDWSQENGAEKQGVQELHRHGLLQHACPASHPSQHPGEPRVVHTVHAVPGKRGFAVRSFLAAVSNLTLLPLSPGGNSAGSPGVSSELPDDDHGPYGCAQATRVLVLSPAPASNPTWS